MSAAKKILTAIIILVVLAVLVVGVYLAYVILSYNRIPDHQTLQIGQVQNPTQNSSTLPKQQLQTGQDYTIVSFNIGFGAYDHDFTFFLDEGIMADGTKTVGTESRARSKEAAEKNTQTVLEQTLNQRPDIMLFQEVDVKADRSWNVNQMQAILDNLPSGTWYDYAINFHSAFLFYPPTKPIGQITDAGLLTISNYEISSAERRSLPVSDGFPTKYFDLDRCISVSRLPVSSAALGAAASDSTVPADPTDPTDPAVAVDSTDPAGQADPTDPSVAFADSAESADAAGSTDSTGPANQAESAAATATTDPSANGTASAQAPELVLINVHPSAYDEGGIIRAQQMELLASIMQDEYAKGNYVIVGGDFNHAFGGSEKLFTNGMQQPSWVQPFDASLLPSGFKLVLANNYTEVATCRDTSITYQPGTNYEVVIDGYIVSDNIQATSENIDADYLGSDHNPVRLTFSLLGVK